MLQGLGGCSVLAFSAATGIALRALGRGTLHAAVVHGPGRRLPTPPVPVIRLHLARWQVGLATPRKLQTHRSRPCVTAAYGSSSAKAPPPASRRLTARSLARGSPDRTGPSVNGTHRSRADRRDPPAARRSRPKARPARSICTSKRWKHTPSRSGSTNVGPGTQRSALSARFSPAKALSTACHSSAATSSPAAARLSRPRTRREARQRVEHVPVPRAPSPRSIA